MSTLLPVADDHDRVSDQVRRYSAQRFTQLLNSLTPIVEQMLEDPAGIHDLEPGRIAAYTATIKLYSAVLKDLGALYQVTARPPAAEDPNLVPLDVVEKMLAREREQHAVELELAVRAAEERVRMEAAVRERVSLEVARERVTGALAQITVR